MIPRSVRQADVATTSDELGRSLPERIELPDKQETSGSSKNTWRIPIRWFFKYPPKTLHHCGKTPIKKPAVFKHNGWTRQPIGSRPRGFVQKDQPGLESLSVEALDCPEKLLFRSSAIRGNTVEKVRDPNSASLPSSTRRIEARSAHDAGSRPRAEESPKPSAQSRP